MNPSHVEGSEWQRQIAQSRDQVLACVRAGTVKSTVLLAGSTLRRR